MNGWWPQIHAFGGAIYVAHGAGESWLSRVDVDGRLVSSERLASASMSGQWIRPGVLTWWRESGDPGRYEYDLATNTTVKVSDVVAGNMMAAADGRSIWQRSGLLLVGDRVVADGVGFPVAAADGYVAYATDGSQQTIRVFGPVARDIAVRTPLQQMVMGPGGVVVYGGFGPVWASYPDGRQIDVTVTPDRWQALGAGGAPMPTASCWREPDGTVWLASNTQTDGVILYPLGDDRVILLARPANQVSVVRVEDRWYVATCDTAGVLQVEVVPVDTPRARLEPTPPPVTDPPAPTLRQPVIEVTRYQDGPDGLTVEWQDRQNPGYGGRVWAEGGSQYVELTNPAGTGRTGATRPVWVAPPPTDPPDPPPPDPPAPNPPQEPPVALEAGLVTFFGEPFPDPWVQRMVEDWGVHAVMSDMPTDPAKRAALFAQVARYRLVVRWIVRSLAQMKLVPDGGRAQAGNESPLSPAEYAAWAIPLLQDAKARGIDLAVCAADNITYQSLEWTWRVLALLPDATSVSIHRYPEGISTGPRPGYASLDDELAAFKAVAGNRRLICSEFSLHQAPVTTGFWPFRRTRRISESQQASFGAHFLDALSREGFAEGYWYQHRDGDQNGDWRNYCGVQRLDGTPKLVSRIFAPYRRMEPPSDPPPGPIDRPTVSWPQIGLSYYAGLGDPDFDWPLFLDFCREHGVGYHRTWLMDAWALGERDALEGFLPGQYAGFQPCRRLADGQFDLFDFRADYFTRLRMIADESNRRGIFPLFTLLDLYTWSDRKAGLPFVPDVNRNFLRNNVNGVRWGDPDDSTFFALPDDWLQAFCVRVLEALDGAVYALQIGNEMPEKAMHIRIAALLRGMGYTGDLIVNRNEDAPGQPMNMDIGGRFDRIEFHGTADPDFLDRDFPDEAAAGRPRTFRQMFDVVDPARIILSSDGDGGNLDALPQLTETFRWALARGASVERQSNLKRNRFYGDGTLRMADLQAESAFLRALRG